MDNRHLRLVQERERETDRERARARERESFIRSNVGNGVVSGAARIRKTPLRHAVTYRQYHGTDVLRISAGKELGGGARVRTQAPCLWMEEEEAPCRRMAPLALN